MRSMRSSSCARPTACAAAACLALATAPLAGAMAQPIPVRAGPRIAHVSERAAPDVRLSAIDVTRTPAPSAEPKLHAHLAAVLSAAFPGAGQAYAGEGRHGFLIFSVAASGLGLAISSHNDAGNIGAIVSMAAHVYGIIDAPEAVRRAQARAERGRPRIITE